ncbi:MAG: hypothetical protein HQK75_09535 [Candidatus Magnetomorum sp.]|nr:hypothetical protein [Candidatus Magnetomorum sp.]
MHHIQKIILTTIVFFLISNIAFSKDISTLLSFSHVENQPDNTSTISIEWTAPTIDGDFYYAAFSQGLTFVFSDESYEYDPSDPENVPDQVIPPVQKFNYTTTNTSFSAETDGRYYFNIVIDSDGDYGSTKTIGPFIIDTTAPSPVGVNGLTSTDSNSIELTLEPADAEQICVLLNTTNTAACNWDDIPENRTLVSPTLSEGNNQVYAFFKDVAGNINQASHSVSCSLTENESTQTTEKSVGIPTLDEWGRVLFMGILLFVSMHFIRRKKGVSIDEQ